MSDPVQTASAKKGPLQAVGGACKKLAALAKKHKLLTALLVVLLAVGVAAVVRLSRARAVLGGEPAGSYSFIRTTTLTRGSLDETVSATGSVESADTSTVSYSAGVGASAKVKTIHVAVGDQVAAGDVIVTLDNTDILESIAKAEEALTEQKTAAQESYDAAVAARDEAYATATGYESTVTDAQAALSKAKLAYQTAESSVASYQSDYDKKAAALTNAGTALNAAGCAGLTANDAQAAVTSAETALASAQGAQTEAQSAYDAAKANADAAPEDAALAQAAADALTALTNAQTAAADAQAALDAANKNLSLVQTYAAAETAANDAARLLQTAKQNCSYDSLNQAYQQAQQAYNTARTTLDNYEKQYENALDQVEQAAEKLEDASTSDTLEDLYDQLDACELKAETSGKVTALNATVGSSPNGTVAAIQNTECLKISITISESDVNDVAVGMPCVITSDATEQEISGTLTQIDPIASQNGSFGAEVTVDDADTGLLIGMNATVKIVLSSTADVFTVPLDAVGNDEDGAGDYVYRKTGSEGTDMTFEKVYVTCGQTNDYYVEIRGGDLAEGDVIRSSADLTQGLETVETTDGSFDLSSMMGGRGGMGGDVQYSVGDGSTGGRGQMVGAMPSGGNMPGGEMPSGGFGGGPGGN